MRTIPWLAKAWKFLKLANQRQQMQICEHNIRLYPMDNWVYGVYIARAVQNQSKRPLVSHPALLQMILWRMEFECFQNDISGTAAWRQRLSETLINKLPKRETETSRNGGLPGKRTNEVAQHLETGATAFVSVGAWLTKVQTVQV